MLRMARILWALIGAAGGARAQRQGLVESGDGGSSGLVDWIGRLFALLGAFYLFRDVYADMSALVDDKAPLREPLAPA